MLLLLLKSLKRPGPVPPGENPKFLTMKARTSKTWIRALQEVRIKDLLENFDEQSLCLGSKTGEKLGNGGSHKKHLFLRFSVKGKIRHSTLSSQGSVRRPIWPRNDGPVPKTHQEIKFQPQSSLLSNVFPNF